MTICLEIRHLEMLKALAETGRVIDASEKLGVTPSALSHRIREAERRLGVTLYTRMHKRLRMTPAAEYLARTAERVLADLERTEADIRRMNRDIRHVVRIGTECYSSYHWLPFFLTWFRERRTDLDVQVVADAVRETLTHLLNRKLDLAIVPGQVTQAGIISIPLFVDEFVFIMPPNHRHARKQYIEAKDLENERFITYTLVPEPDQEFARFMRPAEAFPQWTAPVELPEAIVELVAAGIGTSVLTRWAVERALQDGRLIAARLTSEGLAVEWSAALREEDADDSPIHMFAEALATWVIEDRLGFHRTKREPKGREE